MNEPGQKAKVTFQFGCSDPKGCPIDLENNVALWMKCLEVQNAALSAVQEANLSNHPCCCILYRKVSNYFRSGVDAFRLLLEDLCVA